MGFRQNQERRRVWTQWVDEHRTKLQKCGLPPILLESEEAWAYFLDHGDLPEGFGIWSGWNPSMLSPAEAKCFHEFLTSDAMAAQDFTDVGILRDLREVMNRR